MFTNTTIRRRVTLLVVALVLALVATACQDTGPLAGTTLEEAGDADVAIFEDLTPVAGADGEMIAFNLFDADGDDVLSPTEFSAALEAADLDDDDQFAAYDTNEDEMLQPAEFDAFVQDEGLGEADLFTTFDADADNVLSQSEFRDMVAALGMAGEFNFGEFDADEDQMLQRDEFDDFLQSEDLDEAALMADADEPGDVDVIDDEEGAAADDADLFTTFDANADNVLSQSEFRDMVAAIGMADEFNFGEFDADEDQMLQRDEFDDFLQSEDLDEADLMADAGEPGDVDMIDDEEGAAEDDDAMTGESAVGVFDTDGDGVLDEDEFDDVLAAAGLTGQVDFDTYDSDDDGVLEAGELLAFVQDEALDGDLLQDQARLGADAFGMVDTNRDGVLDEEEFDTILAAAGLTGQVDFDTFDTNDDGVLEAGELLAFVQAEALDGDLLQDQEPLGEDQDEAGDVDVGDDEEAAAGDDLDEAAAGILPTVDIAAGDFDALRDAALIYTPSKQPALFADCIDNIYYPLIPGTVYVFEEETDEGTETVTVTVTGETREIMGITATVVHDTVELDGELTEDTYDWYAQDDRGNVWYLGEDTQELEDGEVVSTSGSWEAGVDGALPGLLMPGNPRPGDMYYQEYYAGEAEDMGAIMSLNEAVAVPAGDFDNALQTAAYNPLDDELEHKWYAPGIGVAREAVVGSDATVELVEISHDQDEVIMEDSACGLAGGVPFVGTVTVPRDQQQNVEQLAQITADEAVTAAEETLDTTANDAQLAAVRGALVYVVTLADEGAALVDAGDGTVLFWVPGTGG